MRPNETFLDRNWRSIFSMIIFIIDLVVIFACGLSTHYMLTRYYPGPVLTYESSLKITGFLAASMSFFALLLGVYRQAFFTNSRYHILLAAKSYIYATGLILASFFFLQIFGIPRSFILLFLILMPIFFVFGRAIIRLINRLFMKAGLGIRNVLVVLNGEHYAQWPINPEWLNAFGYRISGFVRTKKSDPSETEGQIPNELPVFNIESLESILQNQNIDRIFIPSASLEANGFDHLIHLCRMYRVKLKLVSPDALGLLRMARVFDIAGVSLYTPPRTKIEFIKNITKRLFDLLGASVIIIILAPIFIFTSLAILLETGFPIIYGQRRSAMKRGREFQFYKFRSMVPDAELTREDLSELNEASGVLFKMKDDPRVTKVGRILRKYSIDELPQLFNVIKGDMSLVGPRPLPISDFEAANFSDSYWEAVADRAKVKPGMTGLWQISGRSNVDFTNMLLLDLYYVEYQSLLFDLEILFETIPAVMLARGAF